MPTKPISPLTDDDGGRPERRRDHDDEAHPRDRRAERRRLVLADAEHVEVAAVEQQHDRR